MTLARAIPIGVGIAAVVLLAVMAPAIVKVMIAVLWGIVIFTSAQHVLGRSIAFVLPIPHSLSDVARPHTLSLVHASMGCRRC